MNDLIDRQQAIEAICMETCGVSLKNERCMVHCTEVQTVEKLPPAQPAQLEQCPIYGGMCAYPSNQCYDCPRHAGARMEREVTE